MLEENIPQIVSAIAWLGCSFALLVSSFTCVCALGIVAWGLDRMLGWYVLTRGMLSAVYKITLLQKEGIDVVEHFRREHERIMREMEE